MNSKGDKKQGIKKYKMGNRITWLTIALACYVNSGYFSFANPFKWNFNSGKVDVIKSKWYTRIRVALIALTVMSTTSQIFTITRDLTQERVLLSDFTTMFRLVASLWCGLLTLLELHTTVRAYPMEEFTNHALKYLNIMEKHRILDSPQKFDRICAIILLSMFVMACGTIGSGLIQYWANCELHILSSVLPTCEESISSKTGRVLRSHKPSTWRIFYLALYAIILLHHVGAFLYYVSMVTVPVLGCLVVLQKMRETTVPGNEKQNPLYGRDMLLLHYRCLQMLFNRINITLGRYVFPCGILTLLILLILFNFATIILPFQFYFLIFVPFYFSTVIFFATIIRQGVFFSGLSKEIIDKKEEDCSSVKEVFALQLRTCHPLRVTCGGFFYLERITLFEILGGVINYTVELLITYSVE